MRQNVVWRARCCVHKDPPPLSSHHFVPPQLLRPPFFRHLSLLNEPFSIGIVYGHVPLICPFKSLTVSFRFIVDGDH